MEISLLFLTCANDTEADAIIKTLLKKRLIACAKKMPVSSSSWWKDEIESGKEVLVIMESIESNFTQIEKEIQKLHSYETFVLVSSPINQSSTGVSQWISKSLKKK